MPSTEPSGDPRRSATLFWGKSRLPSPPSINHIYTIAVIDGKLWELRFHCGDVQQRVAYWIAPDRRIILLTVFRKTRSSEAAEVGRAKRAMVRCQAENHTVDEEEVA